VAVDLVVVIAIVRLKATGVIALLSANYSLQNYGFTRVMSQERFASL
jgi:hypothetical protein